MGVVYRGRDPELDRDVAIKVLASAPAVTVEPDTTIDLREAPQAPDAALDEARVMARVSHPNVLPIFEVGRDGDRVFLVTELVDGSSLRAYFAAPRPIAELARVLALAAHGLAAAHARGVVHRDFKPDNVLVGRDGRVCVCDFGLANLVQPRLAMKRVGEAVGTPRYMAPELWKAVPATPASDVFALCRTIADAFEVV